MKTNLVWSSTLCLTVFAAGTAFVGCAGTPTRSNTAVNEPTQPTNAELIRSTGAANSTGSASGPGTSTSPIRGGSR